MNLQTGICSLRQPPVSTPKICQIRIVGGLLTEALVALRVGDANQAVRVARAERIVGQSYHGPQRGSENNTLGGHIGTTEGRPFVLRHSVGGRGRKLPQDTIVLFGVRHRIMIAFLGLFTFVRTVHGGGMFLGHGGPSCIGQKIV